MVRPLLSTQQWCECSQHVVNIWRMVWYSMDHGGKSSYCCAKPAKRRIVILRSSHHADADHRPISRETVISAYLNYSVNHITLSGLWTHQSLQHRLSEWPLAIFTSLERLPVLTSFWAILATFETFRANSVTVLEPVLRLPLTSPPLK